MSEKFTSPLYVRCPPRMISAVAAAAEKRLTTVSAYTRRAVLSQLESDGFSFDFDAASGTDALKSRVA